jgi:hypothetical protein
MRWDGYSTIALRCVVSSLFFCLTHPRSFLRIYSSCRPLFMILGLDTSTNINSRTSLSACIGTCKDDEVTS